MKGAIRRCPRAHVQWAWGGSVTTAQVGGGRREGEEGVSMS